MNIILDCHSLNILGGIEKFCVDLANAITQKGHTVFLFMSEPLPARSLYSLSPAINTVIYSHEGRLNHLDEFKEQILSCKPDICISPTSDRRHLPWCAALQGTGIPLIISEHNEPNYILEHLWDKNERLAVMHAADGIHMLQNAFCNSLPQETHHKIHIIPNTSTLPVLQRETRKQKTILSIGRLHWEKQNSILIEAFAMLSEAFPGWRLEIWGKGPDEPSLVNLIKKLKLTNVVHLYGVSQSPERCYAHSDILCIASRCESFGLVVLEAMSAGIPCVGFAECTGVNQLIQDRQTGLLAKQMTPESLAECLAKLMRSDELRASMGEAAIRHAQAYAPERVYDAWEAFLTEVARCKGKTQLQKLNNPDLANEPWVKTLRHCINRPNVLAGDGQWLRRFVFSMPWLKRMLHPLWTRYKTIVKKI